MRAPSVRYLIYSLCLIGFFGAPIFLSHRYAAAVTLAMPAHVADQVLVKLKNNATVYPVSLRGETLSDFLATNQKNNALEYLEPNYIYQASLDPNDTYYPQELSYLASIHAPLAWNYTTGKSSVVVAVIDTGVAINHPDLVNNIWHNTKEIPGNGLDDDQNGFIDDYSGWDFVSNSPDPNPKFDGDYNFLAMNHGTIIAGVIGAEGNNAQGIAGLAWRVKIMPLRVLKSDGTGNTLDVAKAIDYARRNGAQIINLSFVGQGESQTLKTAIAEAYRAGILVVAAAGNEVNEGVNMTAEPEYPVCHDGDSPADNWVIGVASVDHNDQLASFSNYGRCVDLVAPGVGVFSTLFKDESHSQYNKEYGGLWSGTSVSAPQVSATAALIKALKPELTVLEMRDLLLNNTTDIYQKNPAYQGQLGRGKLDVLKTVYATVNSLSQQEIRTDKIITAPGVGGGPQIRSFYELAPFSQFFAFDKNKRFGVNASSHDLNNDGQEEVVAAAEKGEEPWVQIFDLKGDYKTKFLAYDKSMKQGVQVAAGDINYDGQDEIITVPQSGFQPLVRLYSQTGNLLGEFLAFNQYFKGGLSVAVADINNDHFDEIIITGGVGSQAYVKIFNYHGQLAGQFLAQDNFFGGLRVAVGDVNHDGQLEIMTAPVSRFGPQVKIFSASGRLLNSFWAYDKKFLGGVYLTAGDINGDGAAEIITGPGPGLNSEVRVYNLPGRLLNRFYAYQSGFKGGVKVAAGK